MKELFRLLGAIDWKLEYLQYAYRHCAPYGRRRDYDDHKDATGLASIMAEKLNDITGSQRLLDWVALLYALGRADPNKAIAQITLEPLKDWLEQATSDVGVEVSKCKSLAHDVAARFEKRDEHLILAIGQTDESKCTVYPYERTTWQGTETHSIARPPQTVPWSELGTTVIGLVDAFVAKLLRQGAPDSEPIIEFVLKKDRLISCTQEHWPAFVATPGTCLDRKYRIMFRSWERSYQNELPQKRWEERWQRFHKKECEIRCADIDAELPGNLEQQDCAKIHKGMAIVDVEKLLASGILIAIWPRSNDACADSVKEFFKDLPPHPFRTSDWREFVRDKRRTTAFEQSPWPYSVLLWDAFDPSLPNPNQRRTRKRNR